jgi:two-component system, OmpR family, KDP operon response regulator KdpE
MRSAPILLVDDDPYLRRACEISLRQHGHTVLVAADGEEALQKARENLPGLILLDLLMPKMSGMEVLVALKAGQDTSQIPVVILSNSSTDQQLGKAKELGALDFIVKFNTSLKELSARVDAMLETLYPDE